MADSLAILNVAQLFIIAYLLFKMSASAKNIARSNAEIERITAKSRLLENNARHSESVLRTYQNSNKLSVSFFTEELSESRFFSKHKRLRYKSQIYLNGIPIGSAMTIKEDVMTHVDQVKIDNMIEKCAIPFLEAGILVANLSPDPRVKAIGAIASSVHAKIRPEK